MFLGTRYAIVAAPIAMAGRTMADMSSSQVTTVVVIKTPAGLTRTAIDAGIEKSIPQYKAVPGLTRRYFTACQTGFGGV
jgi:hypothetical protein